MIRSPSWRRWTRTIARNWWTSARRPRPTCRPAVETLEVREVLTAPTIVGSPLSGPYLSVPTTGPASVSAAAADPTDPARTLGLVFTVDDAETPAGLLTVAATSSNAAVVPDANLSLSGGGADRTLKITPAGVGYADITVTVTDEEALSASYVVQYAASAASAAPNLTRFLTGASDLSAAIPVDNDYMWVGNDEDQVLRLYNRNQSGLPVSTFAIDDATLGLTEPGKEVDIEAATRIGDRLYWMGSMSNRGDQNKDAPNRSRVFATDLSGTGAASTLTFVGHYDNLLQDLK